MLFHHRIIDPKFIDSLYEDRYSQRYSQRYPVVASYPGGGGGEAGGYVKSPNGWSHIYRIFCEGSRVFELFF